MNMPLANGGDGRDGRGRFLSGNSAAVGRGNPHADQVNAWRTALAATVTEDDLRAVIAKLVECARAGQRWAIRELLDRCLGKPVQPMVTAGEVETCQIVLEVAEPPVKARRKTIDGARTSPPITPPTIAPIKFICHPQSRWRQWYHNRLRTRMPARFAVPKPRHRSRSRALSYA